MAINAGPLAQMAPSPAPVSPTAQAQSMAQRAAEMDQPEDSIQSLAMSTMDEVKAQREKLNAAVERMIQSLDRRKALPFDPMLMKMSAAFLRPTKTGSFGESMGYAAEAAAGEAENEYARQQAQAKLELELHQKLLESKQKAAGSEFLQGLMPGAPAGGMPAVPQRQPGVLPGAPSMPPAAPAAPSMAPIPTGAPPAGAAPMGAPPAGGAPAVGGMRRITLADIQRARQFADPDTVKFLETAYTKQLEEEKLGVQERGLEFTIPGTRRTIKNVPLAEQREAQGIYRQSLQANDPQMYLRYLVEKGWIEPETVAGGEPGRPTYAAPLTPEQEKGQEARLKERAQAEEKARQDLIAAGRAAGTVVRDTEQVIRFASDPKYSKAFGILSEPGLVAAMGTLISAGVQTPRGSVGVPAIEDALRKLGKSQAEIDAATVVLQPIANMELNFTRLFLSGQGAITEGERAVVRRLPPSLSDSPKVAVAKSEILKARAVFDQERSRAFRDWERRNPRLGFEDFQDSKEYKALEKQYDQQLFKIQDTYFPSSRTERSETSDRQMGPLERQLRGNQ